MKIRPIRILALFLLPLLFSAFIKLPFQELAIGSPMPMTDVKMKDVSGKEVSLNDVKTSKGTLVIFSCNTCPYVKLSEGRIKQLSEFCASNGIGFILVNSNEAQRNDEDSFDEMVKYHKAQGLNCRYVVDKNSQLANAFGASKTPHCFLFDKGGLVYRGAIDDNVKDPAQVKTPYLMNAITAVMKNERPSLQESKSIGCTIKRLE